jgi:hypothetical protein
MDSHSRGIFGHGIVRQCACSISCQGAGDKRHIEEALNRDALASQLIEGSGAAIALQRLSSLCTTP